MIHKIDKPCYYVIHEKEKYILTHVDLLIIDLLVKKGNFSLFKSRDYNFSNKKLRIVNDGFGFSFQYYDGYDWRLELIERDDAKNFIRECYNIIHGTNYTGILKL